MEAFVILIIENMKEELLDLESIVSFSEYLKIKEQEKRICKIILIQDEDKLGIGTFMQMYNGLVGRVVCDSAISLKEDKLLYNKKARFLKEEDIKEIEIKDISDGINQILKVYEEKFRVNHITYFSKSDNKNPVIKKGRNRDVEYKEWNSKMENKKSIYEVIQSCF